MVDFAQEDDWNQVAFENLSFLGHSNVVGTGFLNCNNQDLGRSTWHSRGRNSSLRLRGL